MSSKTVDDDKNNDADDGDIWKPGMRADEKVSCRRGKWTREVGAARWTKSMPRRVQIDMRQEYPGSAIPKSRKRSQLEPEADKRH